MNQPEHNYQQILTTLCDGADLPPDTMQWAMQQILSGSWSPAQISGVLVALKIKGETPAEIAAAAQVMREKAVAVQLAEPAQTIDTCGTGGDGGTTFNISTAVAFVVAAAGVKVAKHGNRAMSGASGSSDVLEALGAKVALTAEQVAHLIETVGIGFMFAPNYHNAMKHAAPVRRDLAVRTLFNLLGPLSNPAQVGRQVVGVFSPDLLLPYAETLIQLGIKKAWVVHGNGLDEITVHGDTAVAVVQDGYTKRMTISPAAVGLAHDSLAEIKITSTQESKEKLLSVLQGKKGACRDIVLINAAAALVVADKVADLPTGIALAADAIDSQKAMQTLEKFITATNK